MFFTFFGYDGFRFLIATYLWVTLLGVAALPWSFGVFRKTRGGTFVFARVLGIVAITTIPWLLAFVFRVPHRGSVIFTLFLVGLGLSVSWIILNRRAVWANLRRDYQEIIVAEVIFLFFMFFLAAVRAHWPEFQGQEKNMDYMFLRGLVRTSKMPPIDPWFSGEIINYYYGGYLVLATLSKGFAIPPNYLANIAVPLIAGLAGAGAFVVTRALSGGIRWGLLGPFMVCFLSNLEPFFQWLSMSEGQSIRDISYWSASRVIWDVQKENPTINEFPFFSFYHADVHPHVMSLPFVVLFVAVLYVAVRAVWGGEGRRLGKRFLGLIAPTAGVCLGFLGFVNGLDLPVFAVLLMFFVAFLGLFALGRIRRRPKPSMKDMVSLAILGIGGIVVAFAVFSPFFRNYLGPKYAEGPIGLTEFKTRFTQMFTVWGTHLYLVMVFLVFALGKIWRRPGQRRELIRSIFLLIGAVFLVIWFVAWGTWSSISAPFFLGLIPVFVALIFAQDRRPGLFFITICIGFCCGILLGCEIVFIRDSYGQALQRMNTLFKLYFQVWIILGLTLPAALAMVWSSRRWAGRALSSAVIAVSFLFFLAGSLYAVGISGRRLADRERHFYQLCRDKLGQEDAAALEAIRRAVEQKAKDVPRREERIEEIASGKLRQVDPGEYRRIKERILTLNGTAFIREQHPAEAEAIEFLDKRVKGTPVILEQPGTAYKYESRISAYTGLPTPVGWVNHESVWRRGFFWDPEGGQRDPVTGHPRGQSDEWKYTGIRRDEVNRIYSASTFGEVEELLKKYRVKYVFFGEMENADEGYKNGLAKFSELDSFFWEGGEIIIDDGDPGFKEGKGLSPQSGNGSYQEDYRVSGGKPKGRLAVWKPELQRSGLYEISVRYVSLIDSTGAAKYRVFCDGGDEWVCVSQKAGGGDWVSLGRFVLAGEEPFPGFESAGRNALGCVELYGEGGTGVVTVDAVRFKPVAPANIYILD